MEFALHIEAAAIRLKLEALRIIEVATAGGPAASLHANLTAAVLPHLPVDTDEPTVPMDAESDSELPSQAISISKASKHSELQDVASLADAVQLLPTSPIPVSRTGVEDRFVSPRVNVSGRSVYKCRFEGGCPVDFASGLDRVCTHIRRKHLGYSIGCKYCYKSREGFWSAEGWRLHMVENHKDLEADWRITPNPEPLEIKEEVEGIDV